MSVSSDIQADSVPTAGVGDFQAEADRVLQSLRTALTDVVGHVPGTVSKPVELRRALRIDANLSWKVFKVVKATDALAAGPYVPGDGALRTFFKAARKSGVPDQVISAARLAAADFNHLVTTYASDRPAFDSMASSLAGGEEEVGQIALHHRRAAFRAQRHIYGAYAKARVSTLIAQPSSDPRLLDIAGIIGFLALRRLRPDAALTISHVRNFDDNGTARTVQYEPLDPSVEVKSGVPLLPEFCSKPTPECKAIKITPDTVKIDLLSSGIGRKSAIDCIGGGIIPGGGGPRYRDGKSSTFRMSVTLRMPCEYLLHDVLVHEDTFGHADPIAYSCQENLGDVAASTVSDDASCFGGFERPVYMGKGPSALKTPDFPRYAELGHYTFEKLGWDAERFDVYRYRLEYPIMPSIIVMRFPLPDEPAAGSPI